jgi:hypothetical protein
MSVEAGVLKSWRLALISPLLCHAHEGDDNSSRNNSCLFDDHLNSIQTSGY